MTTGSLVASMGVFKNRPRDIHVRVGLGLKRVIEEKVASLNLGERHVVVNYGVGSKDSERRKGKAIYTASCDIFVKNPGDTEIGEHVAEESLASFLDMPLYRLREMPVEGKRRIRAIREVGLHLTPDDPCPTHLTYRMYEFEIDYGIGKGWWKRVG